MIKPTLDEAKTLAATDEYTIVPLSCELYSDSVTAIQALSRLKAKSKHCYMLESVENQEKFGRYTFLGYDPRLVLTCTGGRATLKADGQLIREGADPSQMIRELLSEYKSPHMDYLPSFTGGLVGYFAYDYIQYSEPTLVLDADDQENFQDVDLMLFDRVIAFDNIRNKVILIANVACKDIEASYQQGVDALVEMKNLLLHGEACKPQPPRMTSPLRPLFSEDEFCRMVEKAKHYIYEGDIFQVVLSNRLDADFEGSLLDAYRVLRCTNPSPYMFYFSGDDIEVAGASPETLVKLEGGELYTFPLAGTRPRGETPTEDKRLEEELLRDPKELSEHNMLVDLGRNDLGRISKFGSVKVEKYLSIERFSHVMHIGSTVRGEIQPGKDAVDAVEAVLPAGTLSGAPKIRACQIINELENNKRGLYGGAIGYIDFAGNLDTCIAIRIAYAKNGRVFIRSGAGIVADSVPKTEHQECINKAKAVVKALEMAQEGLDHDCID